MNESTKTDTSLDAEQNASESSESYTRHVFIDTEVFKRNKFNLDSAAFQALRSLLNNASMTLVMPDPTEREIDKHLKEMVSHAVKSVAKVEREVPLIRRISSWPVTDRGPFGLEHEIGSKAREELREFYTAFESVKKIDYSGVKLDEIMNWYHGSRAPFRAGRKRKEFPDALALQMIASYAEAKGEPVAVISGDGDFAEACTYYPTLFHYKEIKEFTETMRAQDVIAGKIRALLDDGHDELAELLVDDPDVFDFYTDNWDSEIEEVVDIEVTSLDSWLIGVGSSEFTFGVDVDLSFTATLTTEREEFEVWPDGSGRGRYTETVRGEVSDSASLSGVVKATTNKALDHIEEYRLVQFDSPSVLVSATNSPYEEW